MLLLTVLLESIASTISPKAWGILNFKYAGLLIMKSYPTLTEMGVSNPEQIQRYSLSTLNKIDHLRIIYRRKKGSFLPTSKRFEFGRSSKTVVIDSGTRQTGIVHEISPFLQRAIIELEGIIDNKKTALEHKVIIKDEMQRLQQEMNSRLAYIESLIDDM
jgi:hypothetical protein